MDWQRKHMFPSCLSNHAPWRYLCIPLPSCGQKDHHSGQESLKRKYYVVLVVSVWKRLEQFHMWSPLNVTKDVWELLKTDEVMRGCPGWCPVRFAYAARLLSNIIVIRAYIYEHLNTCMWSQFRHFIPNIKLGTQCFLLCLQCVYTYQRNGWNSSFENSTSNINREADDVVHRVMRGMRAVVVWCDDLDVRTCSRGVQ